MIRANKIRINKYKSEYIMKLVGVYIRQKLHLTADSIGTKMGDINRENFRMHYTSINHLVRLYDTNALAVHNKVVSPAGSVVINTNDLNDSSDTSVPLVVCIPVTTIDLDLALDYSTFPVIQERNTDNGLVYRDVDPMADSNIEVSDDTISILTATTSKAFIKSQTKWSSFGSA